MTLRKGSRWGSMTGSSGSLRGQLKSFTPIPPPPPPPVGPKFQRKRKTLLLLALASIMERLQLVQNTAARLYTGTCKFQHITPILTTLQCLPVKLRGGYKMLTLFIKALHNLAPIYLTELLQTYKFVRPLRSRFVETLSIPRSSLKHSVDQAFAIVGPTLWNNLLVAI